MDNNQNMKQAYSTNPYYIGDEMRTPKDKIIALCGSIRFKEDFVREEERLTKKGYIVLKPGCWDHLKDLEDMKVLSKEYELKCLLAALHIKKIEMADEILVINKNGYIGKSTAEEIECASRWGKTVTFMEVGGKE